MKESVKTLFTSCGREMKYHEWLSDSATVRGTLQIVHGLAEYGGRYRHFAEFMSEQGFHVFAADHFGHGNTAGNPEELGHFDDRDGWAKNRDANLMLSESIQKSFSEHPLFLLGHSMGSAIARDMLAERSDRYSAAILSGPFYTNGFLLQTGIFLSNMQILFKGRKHKSALITRLTFGPNNKRITRPETKFDWLSHDPELCHRYTADPYCGFVCTAGFFRDFFHGIANVQNKGRVSKISPSLPLLLLSGEEDPVGNYGTGVKKVHDLLTGAGLKNVELDILPGMRHEILNETDKLRVYDKVLAFILKHLS